MTIVDYVSVFFLAVGAFFGLTGALGILRMPDFYTRLHPAGKSDTLAQSCIMIGLMFQVDFAHAWTDGLKLLLIAIFLWLSAPTATHAITQAAYLAKLKAYPQKNDENDDSEGAL